MIIHRVYLEVDLHAQSTSMSGNVPTISRSFIPVVSLMQHYLKAKSLIPNHS